MSVHRIKQFFATSYALYLFTALISVFFSLYFILINDTINRDGILYIRTAYHFVNDGLIAAYHTYSWPFFSMLIGIVHQITALPLVACAYTVTIALQIMLAYGFIALVRELGGNRQLQWIAAITILLFPHLNDYRDYLIRDFGYWAFCLWSLVALTRYMRTLSWWTALGWGFGMLVAISFRVEGAPLMILVPIIVLLHPRLNLWQRIKYFLKVNCVGIVFTATVIVLIVTIPRNHLLLMDRLITIKDVVGIGWKPLVERIYQASNAIGPYVMGDKPLDNTPTIIVTGIFGYFFVKVITGLGVLVSIICGYGMVRRVLPADRVGILPLASYIFMNSVMMFYFLWTHFFLSGRYLMPLQLGLLVWFPFAIHQLYENWRTSVASISGRRWLFPLICLALLWVASASFIHLGASKAHIVEAGHWLADNTSAKSRLYTNSSQVMFYAKGPGGDWDDGVDMQSQRLSDNTWQQYDYLAIRLRHRDDGNTINKLGVEPIKTFANRKNDRVVIVKVKADE
ncbi:MAG: hypothetical protein CMF50_02830 [Legionellales bacterium]|nr:hypothetical protein [Legionellales bacterium]